MFVWELLITFVASLPAMALMYVFESIDGEVPSAEFFWLWAALVVILTLWFRRNSK